MIIEYLGYTAKTQQPNLIWQRRSRADINYNIVVRQYDGDIDTGVKTYYLVDERGLPLNYVPRREMIRQFYPEHLFRLSGSVRTLRRDGTTVWHYRAIWRKK